MNGIARREPGSAFTDADLHSLDDTTAQAVLDFLGAVQIAVRDGVVSQPVKRLLASMGRVELQLAVKAFRRNTPQTTVPVRAHMLTPEFQQRMRDAQARNTKSAARQRREQVNPAAPQVSWLVAVERDVIKWASQEALDVTRLNEVSKRVRAAGPGTAPGRRRVKPAVYDLRSAQGGDFRLVAVAAGSPERTLTFQAVYKHRRSAGKQLHRGQVRSRMLTRGLRR